MRIQNILSKTLMALLLLVADSTQAQLTPLWGAQGRGSRADEGKAIARDAAGNLYVTGYFREVVVIGTDTLRSQGNNRRDIFVAKYDAEGNALWAKAFVGPVAQDDRGRGIAVDAAGNLYITGEMRGRVQFGPFLLDHADGTNRNGYLVKLDNDGNVLWANMIESIGGDDRSYGVQVGPDGNIYVAGQCGNNTVFAAGAPPVPTAGGVDAFVAQYAPDGTLNWVATGGGSGPDRFLNVAFDADGNIWAAGYADAAASFTYGGITLTPVGDRDIVLAKLDKNGQFLFATNTGGTGLDEATAISYGPDGLLYVAGLFSGSATIAGKTLTSNGGTDAIVMAFDANGQAVDATAFGGPGNDGANALAGAGADLFVGGFFGLSTPGPGQGISLLGVDYPGSPGGDFGAFLTQHDGTFAMKAAWAFNNTGGVAADGEGDDVQGIAADVLTQRVYVTGQFFGAVDLGGNTISNGGSSNSDFYIAGFGYKKTLPPVSELTTEWIVKGQGSNRTDEGKAIARDAAGNLYVTGYFREVVVIGTDTLRSQGNNRRDIFVAKYDAEGNALWAKAFVGPVAQDDRGRGIAVDAAGNLYITGEMRGRVQFGPFLLDHADGTNRNGYLVKLDNDGNVLWANMIESIGGDDRSYGVQVGPDGNIYVAGQCGNNTVFAAGAPPVPTAGGVDAFVAQYSPEGAFNWAATGGGSSADRFFDVLFDADGNFWAVGYAGASTTYTFGPFSLTSQGDADVILAQLSPQGEWLWVANFGGPGADEGVSLTYGPGGLLYLTGYISGTATIGTKTLVSAGGTDVFVAAFDADGNPVGAASFGGTGNDYGYAVRGTSTDLFVSGYYGLTAGPPGAPITLGGVTYPGSVGGDGGGFLTQHDANFNLVSAIGFQGEGGVPADGDTDDMQAVVVDAASQWLYATGQFFGTVSIGGKTLTASGNNSDFYVAGIRYAPSGDNTAFVQVIHNVPDPAAAVVDIYINGDKVVDDFAFRMATPFVGVNAFGPLTIAVAPANSQSASDAIATFPGIQLTPGERYVVVANGVLDPGAFQGISPAGAFDLHILSPAYTNTPGGVGSFGVAVMHGSPDAPAVDVFAEGISTALINDITYPEATPYLAIPAADYLLNIAASADSTNVLKTYLAPLTALNNTGVNAAVVLASGFLQAANVTADNAFGLWAALPAGGPLVALPEIRSAFVQIVHNSPDTTLRQVDVFLNGQLVLDNFTFRTATPFLQLRGNLPYTIGIKPAHTADAPQEFTLTFENDKNYVVTASGLWNPFDYAGVGFTDFLRLDLLEPAFQLSVPGTVSLAVQHGAPDAPTVDIVAGLPPSVFINDLAYGTTLPYQPVPTGDYLLGITPANDNSTVLARFYAELQPFDGNAAVVYASGFVQAANAFANAPFGLWVALPGGGPLLPFAEVGSARVQYVHNSPDPAVAEVDVYVNGVLAVDNFAFRTSTPFIEQFSNVPNLVSLAPPNSTSVNDAIRSFLAVFETDKTYAISVNGVLNPGAFTGVPPTAELQLVGIEPAFAAAPAGQFAAAVVHGAPDAPPVDVLVAGLGFIVADNLAFGDATPYLTVPVAEYVLSITPANDNTTVLRRYRASLNVLPGSAGTVFASGFFDAANQTGSTNAFGLWVALPSGGPLVPLADVTSAREVLMQADVRVWPTPTSQWLYVRWENTETLHGNAVLEIFDSQGHLVLTRVVAAGGVAAATERLDVSALPSGVYWLRWRTLHATTSCRMVVSKNER